MVASGPTPEELLDVVDVSIATLERHVDADWTAQAGTLDWTCRETLEHLATLRYGLRLASRATTYEPLALSVLAGAPIVDLLTTTRVVALVLADVVRAAPPSARAFHPAGMADPSGFVAMAMDELLIHTYDITSGLGASFEPSPAPVVAVLDRLFPWWPRETDPWDALLWANGRRSLPHRPHQGSAWLWHCAPLEEWDGVIPQWDPERGTKR